ncbi:hypothetical protein [Micromonospora chersina]|uniref:hypothetical protein n=1 Tax=Micromonospora chersina TaxID=47854 RepID=UPI003718BAB8
MTAHRFGTATTEDGIYACSEEGKGVVGESDNQAGVMGLSKTFVGVWGESRSEGHAGVFGTSDRWQGVHGRSTEQVGVTGVSEKFVGVWGESRSPREAGHAGVLGVSENWDGVHGKSTHHTGVAGISDEFVGVWAETKKTDHPALVAKAPKIPFVPGEVSAPDDEPGTDNIGKEVPGKAAHFDGSIEVIGNIMIDPYGTGRVMSLREYIVGVVTKARELEQFRR